MAHPPDDAFEELTRRVERLQAELARAREANGARARRRHGVSPWLGAPLLVAASWVLSAQAPAGAASDVEQRLAALERLIRRGPGGSTQISAPFEVVGPGRTMLRVANDVSRAAMVNIAQPAGLPGGLLVLNSRSGREIVSLGERASGGGAVAASDGSGAVRALVNGESGGMVVFDANKAYQAGVVVGSDGIPRVAIWSGDTRVAVMTVDVANGKAGLLEINSPAGKTAARVSSGSDGAGAVKVMGAAGRPVAGVLGNAASGGTVVVATPAGQSLAQMSVSSDGRGLVQIFGRGDRPVAVLTQATETPGGLLQISNTAGPVANVTVSSRGGGYFQLNDASGRPTVEGGTLPSGLGMLRAGPAYKCAPAQASTPIIAVGLPDCIVGASSK